MFTVYVLYSPKHSKIYIGYTSDLKNRLESHNIFSTKGYTSKFRPWEILLTEDFEEKKTAMVREKQMKSAKGREAIWKLVAEKYLR